MTKLSQKALAEIRAALKSADGWPWHYEKCGQMVFGHSVGGCSLTPSDYRVADIRGWGHLQYLGIERGDAKAEALQDANGELIAKAPEYIDKLLSHISALEAQRDGVMGLLSDLEKHFREERECLLEQFSFDIAALGDEERPAYDEWTGFLNRIVAIRALANAEVKT